jgi:hypothetical protein
MPTRATYALIRPFGPPLQEERTMLNAAGSKAGKTVFLSHSSKDNALVPSALGLLQKHGGQVYVDLGDDRLPDPPSVETAQILRDSLRGTSRFVLLVTRNSKGSIWIPWELGLADGSKTPLAVALLPVAETASEERWEDREYLGLYSRIAFGGLVGHNDAVWMVYDHHARTGTELSTWLRGW